jgi:hypothetical protein
MSDIIYFEGGPHQNYLENISSDEEITNIEDDPFL